MHIYIFMCIYTYRTGDRPGRGRRRGRWRGAEEGSVAMFRMYMRLSASIYLYTYQGVRISRGAEGVSLLTVHQTQRVKPENSGDTTPCRMTGVTLHSRVRYKEI